MGRVKVTQRIVLTVLGADVDSDTAVNLAIDCAHFDLTENDLTLVVNQHIALKELAQERPTTIRYVLEPRLGQSYPLASANRMFGPYSGGYG